MKKYVNGKLVPMTEKDVEKRKSRLNRINRNSTSNNSARIKELENTVAMLSNKLAVAEQQ